MKSFCSIHLSKLIRVVALFVLLVVCAPAQAWAQVSMSNLTSGRDTDGCSSGSACVSASITWSAGDVLVLTFLGFGSGYDLTDANTITATGVTWTEVGTGNDAFGGNYTHSVYVGVAASGQTTTVSIEPSVALDDAAWIIDRAATGTISTSAPVTQTNKATGTSATPSTTLAAFGSGSATYVSMCAENGPLGPGTGFTELDEQTGPFGGVPCNTAWRNDADTTPDGTQTGSALFTIIAAELAIPGGGGGGGNNSKLLMLGIGQWQ